MIKVFLAELLDSTPLPHPSADSDTIKQVLTTVFEILGALAFLMIVIAGLRYIRAGSDSTRVSDAKRQIAHALVGLVVAALAEAIINFVLGRT
jgi:hypothetical protein